MSIGAPLWNAQRGPARVMDSTTFPAWTTRAACIDLTHRFFVDDVAEKNGRLPITGPIRKAKAICAGCPVRRECLTYAFELEDRVKAMHHAEAQASMRAQLANDEAFQKRLASVDDDEARRLTEERVALVPVKRGFRSGIFGGVTGPEREQQAHNPNRIEDLLRIFEAQVFTYRLGERAEYIEEGAMA